MRRAAGCALAAVLALAGCTSGPTPSPTASPPSATPIGSPSDSAGVLRFAIAAEPSGFLPPALDAGTARIQHFLYDALYRLDDHLRAQPDLAAGAPSVSSDGRTWVIDLRTSATFSDGSHLSAADVVTTYGLALSPACPFAADQCRLARIHLDAVTAEGSGMVVFSLSAPFAPLQAELLAALPILPAKALGDSLDRLLADAGGTDPVTLSAAVDRITSATSAEGCLAPSPPVGCDLADHIDEMTGLAVAAHLAALDPRRYVDDTGAPDRSSFGAALLARLRDLAAVLTMKKLDRLAAALPLLDLDRAPIGTGAYRLTRYEPGAFVELERRTRPKAGQPARIRAIVLPDPTAAATALLSGQLDWLPDVAPELAPVLAGDPTVHVAARPSGSVRALVFNVRAGHPFAAEVARQALVRCLDRPALVARATQG
ncbi:MAG: ABC transporter substrate-binding protein, partial [Candidatus Limnocylindrales bacterium]